MISFPSFRRKMFELILIGMIAFHVLRHKALVLLNFNIKTKKIYVRLYEIWSRYPDKAIKLGDILYTSSSKFYIPSVPTGIYFIENRVTEGWLVLHTIRRSYKVPVCLLPTELSVVQENGSIYPYYLVSNGPSDMMVTIRKKVKLFEKPKESFTVPSNTLVSEIMKRSSQ